MELLVECYSGRRADERPVRFEFGDHLYMVEEVTEQWYGTDSAYFKVRADFGNSYILRHYEVTDRWELEAFRDRDPGQLSASRRTFGARPHRSDI